MTTVPVGVAFTVCAEIGADTTDVQVIVDRPGTLPDLILTKPSVRGTIVVEIPAQPVAGSSVRVCARNAAGVVCRDYQDCRDRPIGEYAPDQPWHAQHRHRNDCGEN